MTLVVGIDPSSAKLAVVMTSSSKGKFVTVTRKLPKDHTKGCGQAYGFIDELLCEMEERYEDIQVFLEKPVMGVGGAQSTIFQSQIGGAVMAAASRRDVPLRMVNNQSWKKRVCGRGNITKAEVAERMVGIWPELVEHAGKDQDLIDAGAINLFGWHVLTLKKRLRRTR